MDEQGYRFGVGVLVVASVAITVILVLFFGAAPNFFASQYSVTIRFGAAPGVRDDTPVRKNGVQIGRVKSVKLLEDTDGVDLTLELDSQYKIRTRELPQIGTGSIITGDAVVEFVKNAKSEIDRFDGTRGSPQDAQLDDNELELANSFLKDGDFVSGGVVAPDPLASLLDLQTSFTAAVNSIGIASNSVSELANNIGQEIGPDGDLQMVANQVTNTLREIEKLVANPDIPEILQFVNEELPKLKQEAETTLVEASEMLEQFETTLAAFEGVGAGAEEILGNVEEFTRPFAGKGEVIVTQAVETLENLDALLGDLRTVSASVNRVVNRVNNGQGTIAKLVDDDQLYWTLVSTLQNIETVTRRLEPVINDVRIFTDKISRNPSSLVDLKGAIRHRPGGGIK